MESPSRGVGRNLTEDERRIIGQPVAVESGGHPLRQMNLRHRSRRQILGIQDDQITAIGRRIVDIGQQPSGTAGPIVGRRERRLGRIAPAGEHVTGRVAGLQVVTVQRPEPLGFARPRR